ncbi:hypothetical protein ACHQM5_025408 [Ranunculus cassubicifolius]
MATRKIGMHQFLEMASRKSILITQLHTTPECTPNPGEDLVFRIFSPMDNIYGVDCIACDDEHTVSTLIYGADIKDVRDNVVIRIKSYRLVDDRNHFYDPVLYVFNYELEPSDVDLETNFDITKWPKTEVSKYIEELDFNDPKHSRPREFKTVPKLGDNSGGNFKPCDEAINCLRNTMKPFVQEILKEKLSYVDLMDLIDGMPTIFKQIIIDEHEKQAEKGGQDSCVSKAEELNDEMSQVTLDAYNGMVA